MQKDHTKFIFIMLVSLFIGFLLPLTSLAAEYPGPPRIHGTTPVARAMAGGQAHLCWDAPDPATATGGGSADYYRVYRHELPLTVPLNWQLIADDSSNTLVSDGLAGQPEKWYVDSTAAKGKRYAYEIKGVDESLIDEEGPGLISGSVEINTTANLLYFYIDSGDHGGSAEFRYEGVNWKIEAANKLDTTTHAYFYSADAIPAATLNTLKTRFDGNPGNDIYSIDTNTFGEPDNVDGDSRVTLHLDTFPGSPGLYGYFWSVNQEATPDYKTSNHREMIYVAYDKGLNDVSGTMAHEFQHCIHYARDDSHNELNWIDEGCAVLAEDLAGYFATWVFDSEGVDNFINTNNGNKSLWIQSNTAWFDYGVSGVWMMYNYKRVTAAQFKSFVDDDDNGISAYPVGGISYRTLFKDWTVANYLNNHADFAGGHYDYSGFNDPQLNTFEVTPGAEAANRIWKKDDIPDEDSDYTNKNVGIARGQYLQWSYNAPAGSHGRKLVIMLKDVKDILGHHELVYILEDGNGGKADALHEEDVSWWSGYKGIKVEDFGKEWNRVTLIINNPEQTSDDYRLASYYTERPQVIMVTIRYQGKTSDAATALVGQGQFQMIIQFDQEMNTAVHPDVTFDPKGAGAGAGPINVTGGSWSKTVYDNDTWTGTGSVPDGNPDNYDGGATIRIANAQNFNEEILDMDANQADNQADTNYHFEIDTKPPEITLTPPGGKYFESVTVNYKAKDDHLDSNAVEVTPAGFSRNVSGDGNEVSGNKTFADKGTYNVSITAKDKVGNEAHKSATYIIDDLDNSDPTFIQYSREEEAPPGHETPYQFSPISSPQTKDTLPLEYSVPQSSLVSILIYGFNGDLVKTLVGGELRDAGNVEDVWDGRDDSGELAPDGIYRFIISGVNIENAFDEWNITGEIVIDNTLPVAEIDFIKADTPYYNYYTIIGTAADEHFKVYDIECISEDTQVYLFDRTTSVNKDVLWPLDVSTLEDGLYIIRLTVTDHACNTSTSEMPITINRSTNALKIHINSITKTANLASEGYIPTADDVDIWIDDDLPAGSTQINTWEWDSEITYSGSLSHTDPASEGTHGHYFIHADDTMSLTYNDNIIQYVYLDPSNPPQQILLQFYTDDGNSEHRAYWGSNSIPVGEGWGSSSLYRMGSMPETGRWIRLKIPASTVGLSGKDVKGVSFVTYGGKAYWDKTTKSSNYNETQTNSWTLASNIGSDDNTDVIINYSTTQDANIVLDIVDKDNNHIKTLIDEFQEAGIHQILWDSTDDSGYPVVNGKYFFQFTSPDGPIDSNAYSTVSGDWTGLTVDVNTSVTDSTGNRYEISSDNQSVDKFDVSDTLLFTITAENLGLSNLAPVALGLDINDNLFIVDSSLSKIFKMNPVGYYLGELPYPEDMEWTDMTIGLSSPNAAVLDDQGDLLIRNQDGAETIKLAVGRGIVDISNITAEIRVPYENSLVAHSVPVIGTASAKDFDHYTVEYGAGESPTEWTTIVSSSSAVIDDYQPIPPVRTIYGNLATWHTARLVGWAGANDTYYIPMGTYTIRLTVYNQDGDYRQDAVTVEMANLIGSWAGSLASEDGLLVLEFPYAAVSDDFDLFSIKPLDPSAAPAVSDPDVFPVGNIYQIKPAGYQFLKTITLKMYYTDDQVGGFDENTLKIYRWNPLIQRWIFVDADLDTGNNVLTTTLTKFNDYEVFYAVMSDPPPAPVIYQPASPTNLRNITVFGKASPSVNVELFVNNISQGNTEADENTGNFVMAGVQLNIGDNELTALAVDPVGNTSPLSGPVTVRVNIAQPTDVSTLSFMTGDFSTDFTGDVGIGDNLYIELVGTDADNTSVDSAMVTITSSITDPDGISIQLLESAANSGIYRGVVTVGETSNTSTGTIGVSSSAVETITVISDIEPGMQDSVNTIDTVPPNAPSITSSTHPSLCQDTFEADSGQWSNMSNSFGAAVTRSDETASSGNYSIKIVNTEDGGDFANYVRTSSFDARQYPMISFDYKIPEDVKINLIAYVNGMWKEIVFTDDPKTVETFGDDLYRTIGYIDHVVADNTWQYAKFNLYNMLRNDDPDQEEYIVEELFFADYNLPSWMEFIMGEENAEGATYYIDNFIISEGGKSNSDPVFEWSANDSSVVEYSYALDQNPGTIPDQISEGSVNTASFSDIVDGAWYFHVRSLDGGGNWGPANHYRIKVDASGPVADTPVPANGSSSGSLEVKVQITDGTGSGVDPDTIQLQVNDVVYDITSGGLKYDENSETLTFSLWMVTPAVDPWPDGEVVQASVISAYDFAGNELQEIFTWSWTVDYSQMTGGYLSLLTTQGGFTPSWSPDNARIAFMSERSGNQDVWVIDSDDYAELNGTAIQLTFDEGSDHHPAWSPIDDRIAFVSNRDGYEHIYTINADGTGLAQLTSDESDDLHPSWSPDGSKIVFSREGEIWMIDSDGSNETQITYDSIEWYLDPVWSPDGEKIAFTRSLYVDEVAVMNIDGTGLQVLTESGLDMIPEWSRGSDQIIFATMRDEMTSALRVINSNGSSEAAFIDNESRWWDSEPAQSRVNDNIAIQSTRNGTWNIWVKTQLQMTDVRAYPEVFSPNDDGIKDTLDIAFNIIGGTPEVSLMIYDSQDNLVATLLENDLSTPGENVVTWNGEDDFGNIVNDGVYTYKITIQGSAGASAIEKSGTVHVDTTPPTSVDWVLPDAISSNPGQQDPLSVVVTVIDETNINEDTTRLQYGIASSSNETVPDVIGWTDFGSGSSGVLDLGWFNFDGMCIYVRIFTEDRQGNVTYSDVQIRFIGNNGPTAPSIYQPVDQTEVTVLQPYLSIENSSDLEGDSLTYDFEVYSDAAMVNFVAGQFNIPEESQTTAWLSTELLNDNTWYYWRVRAFDGMIYSEWTYGRFFVNTENDEPGAFNISTPQDDSDVDTLTPVIAVTNSVDVDEDVVTYTFEVFSDISMTNLIASASDIPAGEEGSTSWSVDPELNDNAWYYWHAIAIDEHGAQTETGLASFFVNTENDAPQAPEIVFPEIGSEINVQDPELVINNAFDPDEDDLTYYFELDTANTFDTPLLVTSDEIFEGSDTTTWHVTSLDDNTEFFWRAKASDGYAESPWSLGSFFVNTANDPPSVPTLNNPGEGAWVDTLTPTLLVNPSIDSENDEIIYQFEVYEDVVLTQLAASGGSSIPQWVVSPELADNTWYFWRVQAEDEHGSTSGWMNIASFFVDNNGVDDSPEIAVIEPSSDIVTNGPHVEIIWEDTDPDSNADIALYYDMDSSGEDGTLIVDGLKEDPDGESDSHIWDISSMRDGTYYVYATITDGTSYSTSYYAPGAIIIDGTKPTVSASPSGGVYTEAQSVTLAANESADIYYTTDGSDPTTASFQYSLPIEVTETTTIRFMAVDAADNESEVEAETYTIGVSVNIPPEAHAGEDITISLGEEAFLDGLASNDPDDAPEPLTYSWEFVIVPAESVLTTVDISDADTASASFMPDVCGSYELELTVTDGLDLAYDTVGMTVEAGIPGDLDGDDDVDYDDYLIFLTAYGSCEGDPNFLDGADLDGDGCVTINDYRILRSLI